MLIDWFTVCAQIINFLILIWLLNRFLYKPILNAIDAREQRIASQLEYATQMKTEAENARMDYEQKIAGFEQQRLMQMNEAAQQAESERQQLIEKARRETAELKQQWLDALSGEQNSLNQQLSQRIEQEVFKIARKTLHDLSSTELEQQITTVFIQRLQTQAKQLATQLNQSPSGEPCRAIIRSQFTLTTDQQSAIDNALNDIIQQPLTVQFQSNSSTCFGIECVIGSFKIAWNIDDYLERMQASFNTLIHRTINHSNPDASAESANTH